MAEKSERGHRTSYGQLRSMLRVDLRRMFTERKFYIMAGIALLLPILILVMTNMFGEEAGESVPGFENTWSIIAEVGDENSGMMQSAAMMKNTDTSSPVSAAEMQMDMTGMCNINLLYFMEALLVCLFVAEDFKSGFSKNLFTVRAKKGDYVASKTIVCSIAGALLLLAFFVGAVIGGRIAGLSFDLGTAGVTGLAMCMLAKMFLMSVFAAIFLFVSVCGKHRAWLSVLLSLFGGILLFMMIPMLTPLNSGIMNVFLCLAGGVIFSTAIGAASNTVLRKTSLV